MANQRQVTPAEWEVLQYILEHHPIPVREVAEHFGGTHGHARTTVLTLMERLRTKGYLTRRKIDQLNHYSPSGPKNELLQGLVREFVQKALGGSVSPFVAYLSGEARLKPEELDELKRLVDELDAQQGGDRE